LSKIFEQNPAQFYLEIEMTYADFQHYNSLASRINNFHLDKAHVAFSTKLNKDTS